MIRYITIGIPLLLFAFSLDAQKTFNLSIDEARLQIKGESISGYKTDFDFIRADVRYGWWKYIRKIGNPTDMRDYYEVKIPREIAGGDEDILVYTQSVEAEEFSTFLIGSEQKSYEDQVRELLIDFKRNFYIQYYVEQIEKLEKKAQAISEGKASVTKMLNELAEIQFEIERIKEVLKQI